MAHITVTVAEEERQMLILALAQLSIERPGWHWTLGELAEKFSGRAMFESFREMHQPPGFHAHLDDCTQCREDPFDLCPIGAALLRDAVDASDRP